MVLYPRSMLSYLQTPAQGRVVSHVCCVECFFRASFRYYVNGELIGSMPTSSNRSLKPGGKGRPLTLGIRGGAYESISSFGGQMFFLNFYAKELSPAEVKGMADLGICVDMLIDEHQEVRLLKWEDILEHRRRRRGTVTDVDLTGWCRSSLASRYKELLKCRRESEVEGVRLVPLHTGTPGHSGEPVTPTKMSQFLTDDQCSEVTSELHEAREEMYVTTRGLDECYMRLYNCYVFRGQG